MNTRLLSVLSVVCFCFGLPLLPLVSGLPPFNHPPTTHNRPQKSKTNSGAILHFITYWLVGLPAGCLLGFALGWGALGLWMGVASATALQAVALHAWLLVKWDWNEEVKRSEQTVGALLDSHAISGLLDDEYEDEEAAALLAGQTAGLTGGARGAGAGRLAAAEAGVKVGEGEAEPLLGAGSPAGKGDKKGGKKRWGRK